MPNDPHMTDDDSAISSKQRNRFRNALHHLLYDPNGCLRQEVYDRTFSTELQDQFELAPIDEKGRPLPRQLVIDKLAVLAAHNPEIFEAAASVLPSMHVETFRAEYERSFALQQFIADETCYAHPDRKIWTARIALGNGRSGHGRE